MQAEMAPAYVCTKEDGPNGYGDEAIKSANHRPGV